MTFSSQKIKFYVSIDGTTYGASRTDQAGVRPSLVDGRTVCGEPVEFIGEWNKSQMPFAPFANAVAKGVAELERNRRIALADKLNRKADIYLKGIGRVYAFEVSFEGTYEGLLMNGTAIDEALLMDGHGHRIR